MKKIAVLGVVLAFSLSLMAQRGGHGGGPPAGVGMGHPNGPPSNTGNSGNHDNHQQNSNNSGQKTPDELLNQNKKLTANLQKLLPSTTTPQQACQGFRNLGQCVAAIHVAHNLKISFDDLKAKMLGGASLGSAIHDLKPDANAREEAKKGEKEAKQDMDDSK
jgi:hypothetical protein